MEIPHRNLNPFEDRVISNLRMAVEAKWQQKLEQGEHRVEIARKALEVTIASVYASTEMQEYLHIALDKDAGDQVNEKRWVELREKLGEVVRPIRESRADLASAARVLEDLQYQQAFDADRAAYLWGLRLGLLAGVRRTAEALEQSVEDHAAWLRVLAETARQKRIDQLAAEMVERYWKHLSDLTTEAE